MFDNESSVRRFTVEEARNRAVVAAVYSDLVLGGRDRFLGRLAADVKWTVVVGGSAGGTFYGGGRVWEKAIVPLVREWDGFEFVPFELVPVGDRVYVVGEGSGTHAVTGKRGRASSCTSGI
ncbi:nuclear transport factor 2 family protein [Streptosporangium sp. G11]|uniref:nuclear transport factor 2 family protein n=1 Tax=Streptosporangium sp. G11 TaxID=3436926 RepID=UPI003EBC49FB